MSKNNNKPEIVLSDIEINGFTMTGRASKGESYSYFEADLAEAYINDIEDSVNITEAVNPYWDEGFGFVTPDEIWDEIDDRYGNMIENKLKKAAKAFEEAVSLSIAGEQKGFIPYSELDQEAVTKRETLRDCGRNAQIASEMLNKDTESHGQNLNVR